MLESGVDNPPVRRTEQCLCLLEDANPTTVGNLLQDETNGLEEKGGQDVEGPSDPLTSAD